LYSSLDLSGLAACEPPAADARQVRSTFALGAAGEGRQFSGASDVELRDLAYLNLDLAKHQLDGQSNLLDVESAPAGAAAVDSSPDENDVDQAVKRDDLPPSFTIEVSEDDTATAEDVKDVVEKVVTADSNENRHGTQRTERSESHNSFHLTKMQISQQLRSMSQLSGPSEESDRLTPEAWTFHRRERSGCFTPAATLGSIRSRHLHHASESGIDSSHIPASWGQVTHGPDASSSIYSRPTSPEIPEPYEIPTDLAAVADWPLKLEPDINEDLASRHDTVTSICQPSIHEDIHITIVEPGLPNIAACGSTYDDTKAEGSSPAVTLNRAPSHKSSTSSTTKHSRFLERFTPPKKLVRKRRSIFKCLRAGSRRDQTRSISTPILCSPHLRPLVDGPSDDSEVVTVLYELAAPETNLARSASLNNLRSTAENQLEGVASSPDLRRKPSLAEYERHLSVIGDDRRRPSTRDLNRLSQIEEDDRHEHIPTKKSFSYHTGMQETDPLMQAALERQLREKALFRSPSKRSVPFSESSSLSFLATSWDEPSSAQPQSPERDPLDDQGKKPSAAHLSPPHTPIDGRSRSSSLSKQKQTNSKKPIILHTPSSFSHNSIRSKIGSSLESWSRYPSHTRAKRCESARSPDNVRTFDFALDIKHERLRGTDESDPFIPGRRVLTETSSIRSVKRPLPKSRSATFGSFVRYYSNLFSSPDFQGKGRRTSVTAGGRLEHPELEILSPVLPASGNSNPIMHVHELEQLRPGYMSHIRERTEESVKKPRSTVSSNIQRNRSDHSSSAFRGNSVFVPHSPKNHTKVKTGATADNAHQSDESNHYFSAEHSNSPTSPANLPDRNPDLDGTAETTDPIKRPTPSKAETWSEDYQDCLVVPPSPARHLTTTAEADAKAMLPPSLRPTKRPSLGLVTDQSSLGPSAAIRRFPSVTVVDDRKGHWRSVSFISVQSSKSGASSASFMRESSNDLLDLMKLREREEREKLLQPVM
jgi:hypothetical protein